MSNSGPEGMNGDSAFRYMASRFEALEYLRGEMARIARKAPPFSETKADIEYALRRVDNVLADNPPLAAYREKGE